MPFTDHMRLLGSMFGTKPQEKNPFEKCEVQAFITYLQDIINRMAENSHNCKTWFVSIIMALLALDVIKYDLWGIFICGIPTFIFMCLDGYYLGLERHFRNIQKDFVQAVKEKNDYESRLYVFKKCDCCRTFCNTISAIMSFSVIFFYSITLVAVSLFILLYNNHCCGK